MALPNSTNVPHTLTIREVNITQQSSEPTKPPPRFELYQTICCGSIKHAVNFGEERYNAGDGKFAFYTRTQFDSASYAIAYEEKTVRTAEEVIERDGMGIHGKHTNEERILFRAPQSVPAEARFWIIKRKGRVYIELMSKSLELVRAFESQLFDEPTTTK
ncbi:MAG TPA: hypothetical protein VLV89_00685 [Candidatus Acidoferrum sp.]|nr:hypothetical protein [Candidatus Acidoferrum sp.]